MKQYDKVDIAVAWEDCGLSEQGLEKLQRAVQGRKTIEQLKTIWGELGFAPLLFGMFEQELEYEIVGKPHRFPSQVEL